MKFHQSKTGGISFKAAKIAARSGSDVVITNGKTNNVLIRILNNEEIGTIFYPENLD